MPVRATRDRTLNGTVSQERPVPPPHDSLPATRRTVQPDHAADPRPPPSLFLAFLGILTLERDLARGNSQDNNIGEILSQRVPIRIDRKHQDERGSHQEDADHPCPMSHQLLLPLDPALSLPPTRTKVQDGSPCCTNTESDRYQRATGTEVDRSIPQAS
jgi:hypothetical protein